MTKKYLFLFITTIIFISSLTVYLNLSRIPGMNWTLINILSLIQRTSALITIVLLSVQLFVGQFMSKVIEKYGSWVFHFHRINGIVIYSLVLSHTFSYLLMTTIASKIFDPFYVFIDACVMCKVREELFYSLGRFSFWLLSFTVFVATFRTRPELRKNWRLFHTVNYLVFIFVVVHSFFVGSDVMSVPFVFIFIPSICLGFYTIFYKLVIQFKKNYNFKRK